MSIRQRITAILAVIPAVLIVALPAIEMNRNVASVSQFKNWGLENNITNSHIHVLDAWKIEKGSKDIVVAVVDTGIDPNHIDLKNNLWHDPKTGVYGWDFVENKPNPTDEHGHGTHVSGILGAALNAKAGISGVANQVSIMSVKYYSDKNTGAENLRNSIKALHWAIDHGANIINYSGGGPEFSKEEFDVIKKAKDKGILIVAAAGNERQDADQPENYYYPCAYKMENIICVAATNIRNELLSSSNWGKKLVDVAAPGENILSTVPGGKYAYMSGTSQATAFVTGLAALMLSHQRSLTPSNIRETIRETVDPLMILRDKVLSGGKVNAASALSKLDRIKTRTMAKDTFEKKFKFIKTRNLSSPKGMTQTGYHLDHHFDSKAELKERNLYISN